MMMYKLAALFVFVAPISVFYYRNRRDENVWEITLAVAKSILYLSSIIAWIGLMFWLLRQGALQ